MSETTNNCALIETITAPVLDKTGYATSLSDVFTKINDNFVKVANHDFIKGDTGDSVEIITYNLADNSDDSKYYKTEIKNCIKNHYKISETNTVDNIHPFKDFNENPGYIQMICKKQVNEDLSITYVPVSSLYYVFLDSRFANKNIGKIDAKNFDNITDASCILTYGLIEDPEDKTKTKYGFKILDNAFPTIYYESEVGLCWKVNGNNTGLPVQGIPGKDGLDTKLFLVKANKYSNKGTVVTHIYDNLNGWVSVTDLEKYSINLDEDRNYSALVYCEIDNKKYDFYFGSIIKNSNNEYIAYFDLDCSLNLTLQNTAFINALKSINLVNTGADKIPGLFLPLNDANNEKVHLLSATSITNSVNSKSNLNTDIIFTPVKDINALIGSNTTDTVRPIVNKYLYLKFNESYFDEFIDENHNTENNNAEGRFRYFVCKPNDSTVGKAIENIKKALRKYNYVLRYKLVNNIKSITTNDDKKNHPEFTISDINDNETTDNELYTIIPKTEIISKKLIFVASTGNNNNYNETKITSFLQDSNIYPDFSNCISNDGEDIAGIYSWKLELDSAINFDKDIFGTSEALSKDDEKYLKLFNKIFTDTISPTSIEDIILFNGFEQHKSYSKIVKSNTGFKTKYILNYIGSETSNMCNLHKYIPLYHNKNNVVENTLLTFNYDINITGDDKLSKKNLTVYGDTVTENINVFNNISAKSGEFDTNIRVNKTEISDSIKTNSINSSGLIESDEIIINASNIKDSSNNTSMCLSFNNGYDYSTLSNYIKPYSIYEKVNNTTELKRIENKENYLSLNNTNNISIHSLKNIDYDKYSPGVIGNNGSPSYSAVGNDSNLPVKRKDLVNTLKDLASTHPAITSNIPLVQNNSPIIVSNTNFDSQLLCGGGIGKNYGIEIPSNNKTDYFIQPAGKFNLGQKPTSDYNFAAATEHDFVQEVKFDTVKNFNIHRLSLNKLAESDATANIIRNVKDYTKNYFTNDEKLPSNGSDTHKQEPIFRRIGITKLFKDYWQTNEVISRPANELTQKQANSTYMYKFTLDQNTKLVDNDIIFDIAGVYDILLGGLFSIQKKNYPEVKLESELTIQLCYSVGDTDDAAIQPITNCKYTRKFFNSNIGDGYSNNRPYLYRYNAYYGELIPDTINTDNPNINRDPGADNRNINGIIKLYIDDSAEKYCGYGDTEYLFQTFKFNLDSFTLKAGSNDFNTIKAYLANNNKVNFYIIPIYKLYFTTDDACNIWGSGKTLLAVTATIPNLFKSVIDKSIKASYMKLCTLAELKSSINDLNNYFGNLGQKKISYSDIQLNTIDSDFYKFKSTTITDNGIVIKSDANIMGIGVSNCIIDHTKGYDTNTGTNIWTKNDDNIINKSTPVLFYHEFHSEDYNKYNNIVVPINSKTQSDTITTYNYDPTDNTPEGYACRTNVIPLKDIFNAIRYLRSTGNADTLKQYGL